MADYHNSFATFIPCDDEQDAQKLVAAIEAAYQEDFNDPDANYVPAFEYCQVDRQGDTWGVFLADENEGMNDEVAGAIQCHLAAKRSDQKVVISGSFGCSKLRPDEFGGWAVGITRTQIEWVDAGQYMHDFLNR